MLFFSFNFWESQLFQLLRVQYVLVDLFRKQEEENVDTGLKFLLGTRIDSFSLDFWNF